jgi:hypothetical protein
VISKSLKVIDSSQKKKLSVGKLAQILIDDGKIDGEIESLSAIFSL